MCATITLNYNGVQQLTTRTAKLQIVNCSPAFFEQDAQTFASTWTERVVHCVDIFDDKEKIRKRWQRMIGARRRQLLCKTMRRRW